MVTESNYYGASGSLVAEAVVGAMFEEKSRPIRPDAVLH